MVPSGIVRIPEVVMEDEEDASRKHEEEEGGGAAEAEAEATATEGQEGHEWGEQQQQ